MLSLIICVFSSSSTQPDQNENNSKDTSTMVNWVCSKYNSTPEETACCLFTGKKNTQLDNTDRTRILWQVEEKSYLKCLERVNKISLLFFSLPLKIFISLFVLSLFFFLLPFSCSFCTAVEDSSQRKFSETHHFTIFQHYFYT